ncbi:MAG: alpha/beta hydrolase-fold protein [Clostridia bacterium]
MAFFRGTIRSDTLMMDTVLNVAIPFETNIALRPGMQKDKTIILLHGLKQNADSWSRYSMMEYYAHELGYHVVMPEVQRSFYSDMVNGMNYFTYLSTELPWIMEHVFHLPMERLYVGGLSMGGFGALKLALHYPERFAGALCFSSGFYMLEKPKQLMDLFFSKGELTGIFGNDFAVTEQNNLDQLAAAISKRAQKPRVYIACGTEDFLYAENTRMRDTLQALHYDLCYEQWPGEHNWKFWDKALKRGLAMVSEDRRGVGLLLDQSIEDNIVFNAMEINNDFCMGPSFMRIKHGSAVRKFAARMIQELDIRCFGPTQHTGTLSGGNQQKVCVARALALNPKFLFVSEPTRGIDIGAKQLVLETLVRLNREKHITIVMVSSELNELRSVCDRIAIVSEGKIASILKPNASDISFGLAMSGLKVQEGSDLA